MTYYDILEVSKAASEDVIKMAYKGLVKKYHPDTYDGDKSFAESKMKEINEAYEVLSDYNRRIKYDETLEKTSCDTSNTSFETKESDEAKQHPNEIAKENKENLWFFLKWPVICTILIIAIGSENSIARIIGTILAILRMIVSFAKPRFKTNGFTFFLVAILVYTSFSSAGNIKNNYTEDNNQIVQKTDVHEDIEDRDSKNNLEQPSSNVDIDKNTANQKTNVKDIDYILYNDGNFLIWYLYKHNIPINVENKINNIKAKCTNIYNSSTQADLKMLRYEKEFFKEGYYTLTNKELETDAFYIGQLSNNKPNGYGFIMDTDGNIEYFGEFRNGMKDGVGLLFEKTFTISSLLEYPEEELAKYYGNDLFNNIKQNINNRCVYMGEFKKGKRHGKGNSFEWGVAPTTEAGRQGAQIQIMATVGTYEEDEISGNYKEYMWGFLCAEGNVSSSGTGRIKEYFPESTQAEYVGEIKNWKRHGKGTLYDRTGNVIYDGQWEYGDYK